jgi:phospholipid transport system transporter-binding protein
VLKLPSELTHASASACLVQLTAAMKNESAQVQVDAAALQRFDSSALAVLLQLRRQCTGVGKSMVLQGLPERLRDLAALYGVQGILPST